MPLSSSRLADNMKAKIEALYGPAQNNSELFNFCKAISEAVVEEIVGNGQTNAGQHVTVSLTTGQGSTDQPGTIS